MIKVIENQDSLIFSVRVIPHSSVSGIVGEYDGALKVKLNSPPIDGKANKELMRLLSKAFSEPKSNLEIISGNTSKSKRIQITTSDKQYIYTILQGKK